MFRTTTGGESWQHLDPDEGSPGVRKVAVHPRDSQIVYALLLEGGIRRSADGGDSWVDLPEAPPDAYLLRIDPVRPNTLYAAIINSSALWKSTDEGRPCSRPSAGVSTGA